MTTQPSTKLVDSTTVNTASSKASKKPITKKDQPDTAFAKTFNQLLGYNSASQKVSEEEFFAAAIGQQIKDQFGDETFNDYKTALKIGMLDAAPGHTGPSAEFAAKKAVQYLVLTNKITSDDSRALRTSAFEIAQLDDNTSKLFDGNGGPNDATKAVAKFSKVQELLEQRMTAIKNRKAKISTAA